MINIVLQTILALGIALLMQRVAKSTLVRGVILLPYLIANVVVALVWFWMLDSQLGIVNQFLNWIGIGPVVLRQREPGRSRPSRGQRLAVHGLHRAADLRRAADHSRRSVYEAASLDGADEMKTFWRITLPLLRPVLALVLMITVTGSFQVFDTVAVTTKGGPANAIQVIQFYIFDQAFNRSHFGYACAISVVLFLILDRRRAVQFEVLRAGESDLA